MKRIWVTCLCLAAMVFRASASPDFDREVAPILEAKCLSCHNPDEAKGDVVLANQTEAAEHLHKFVR